MPDWRMTRLAATLLAAFLGLVLIGSAEARGKPANFQAEATQELAEKYSPVLQIRKQEDPLCGTKGEQYQVMAVDVLFDNPAVKLMRNDGKRHQLVKKAPSRQDLRNLDENSYLDFRGDPLGKTCVYAKDFDRMYRDGKAPIAVYAHISREEGHSGFALQYWFYWYFNQFNDLHESDWEGMQITFDADTPEEALKQSPSEMILFQHGGGERASWDDPKVEKEGDHPVVYPAAGSHATFYQSAVYPQNGWNGAGVGCDNTSDPHRELRPQPVLLPDEPTDQGEFSWLSFDGRWGQKLPAFNNGPTGPQTKDQWATPFSWMESQRWSSPRMPGGGVVGPVAVQTFCGVMEDITGVMNLQQSNPWAAYAIILAFLAIVFLVFVRSTWRPVDPDKLRQTRAYGQIVATSLKLYHRHLWSFAILGAVAIPIVGGTQALGDWLEGISSGNGLIQTAADLAVGLGRPAALALVSALVIVFIRELANGQESSVKGSFRETKARFWRVVISKMLAVTGVLLLALTIIGIPFAIRFLVSWSFVQQEVLFTNHSIRDSFRASSELVRGYWWRTVRTMVPLLLALAIMGPLLGLVLIFTPLPLLLVNIIGSIVYAMTIPFASTGTTLLYFDLQALQKDGAPVPRRSWAPWHPSTFGRPIE